MLKTSLALLLSATVASNAAPPASIAATPVASATAIKLDGEFTETVWEGVPAVSDFRQRDPKDGGDPTFRTDVKVVYDASNLYIAVSAHDPEPARLVGLRTRRDTSSSSDWIKVMVDSFHDRRTAFEFGVNPAGVKEDRYWFNDANDDSGWDAVWDVAVSRDGDSWRAEFRIPFSQLRFHPSDNATFGFAVVREIGRLNEVDTWPLLSKSANGFVSSFGELTNLQLNQTPKRLELVPYVVGQVNTQPTESGNPLVSTHDQKATVGADLKYAVRPGLTLTGTVNPDFGQVEADPAVVNLSGFETFFQERRPFFIEGSGMFTFDLDCNDGQCSGLFYSRRIGRSPRGTPNLAEGQYASVPQQTKILGAAKLTGRAGQFSFGALNAVTADESATIATGPLRTTQVVEPLSNYTVVRARREFANQSTIGFMTTATARRLDEFTAFLPGQAFTGGVDWDWRLKTRYAIQGYWAGSSVRGSTAAITELQESTVHSFQRPDADHLEEDVDADVAERLRRVDRAQQDWRIESPLQLELRLQESRLRHQRRRLPPPRRSADDGQLAAVAERHAVEVPAQLPLQPQSVGVVELRRRPHGHGRQRQRALGVRQQLEHRDGVQPQRAQLRRSRDARRRPRRLLQPELELLELPEHRRSQGGHVRQLPQSRWRRARDALGRGGDRSSRSARRRSSR